MRGQILGARALLGRIGRQQQARLQDRRARPPSPDNPPQVRSARPWPGSTKPRYCSASCRTEIRRRSTFCVRDSISSRSSGPSKPSTSTISASAAIRALVTVRLAPVIRQPGPPASSPPILRRLPQDRNGPAIVTPRQARHRRAPVPPHPTAPRPQPPPPSRPACPLQCRTMSQPAARARVRPRRPSVPHSACIDRSSVISRPSKPISSRITRIIAGRQGGRCRRQRRRKTICAVIASGRSASARNGREIGGGKLFGGVRRPGAGHDACPSWPGHAPACASSPAGRPRPAGPAATSRATATTVSTSLP